MVVIKMRYSVQPKDLVYVKVYIKGYRFLSFAKNIGKNLSNKYIQKLLDSATHAPKFAKKSMQRKLLQRE